MLRQPCDANSDQWDHLATENSGHVSGTVKHSRYKCAGVERLEDDQVISVCANSYRVTQIWTRRVVMRSLRNFLAVLPYLSNKRDSAPRIVERDVSPASSKSISACGVKCARIHFARPLVILVYLRSRRFRTSVAGFGLPLRRPFSISPRRPSITAWRRVLAPEIARPWCMSNMSRFSRGCRSARSLKASRTAFPASRFSIQSCPGTRHCSRRHLTYIAAPVENSLGMLSLAAGRTKRYACRTQSHGRRSDS